MASRRFQYDRAFEHYLRSNRIPYVCVDEARKSLLPRRAGPHIFAGGSDSLADGKTTANASLKSFDFVVYSPKSNLLVDVKGRRCASPRKRSPRVGPKTGALQHGQSPVGRTREAVDRATGLFSSSSVALIDAPDQRRKIRTRADEIGRLESWVTNDDVTSLSHWQNLFGAGFRAEFVFVYLMAAQPPDALFQEIFTFEDDWYAVRSISLDEYRKHMVPRSARWGTWWIPTAKFRELSRPFDIHHLFEK